MTSLVTMAGSVRYVVCQAIVNLLVVFIVLLKLKQAKHMQEIIIYHAIFFIISLLPRLPRELGLEIRLTPTISVLIVWQPLSLCQYEGGLVSLCTAALREGGSCT